MIDEVPGYRILARAGEGGFSVVYRAHQERLDRLVALKVLSVDAVDDDTMRRFERECQITGRLTGHPNVVTVLDTGMTSGGRPFIAMDYFERGSVRDRLAREGPLPLQDVLRIGVKIAGALAATHEAEVLHRDVKPQNILVSKYGEPALADFGVARLVDSAEATHTNAFTPHHAAPEVVNGQQPGVAADVYALASSLYQLISGSPAFKAGSASGMGALMMRILNDPPPPFQRPDVPQRAYEVIARAMAKDPAHRYPTAVAFAAALQGLQAELGLPVTEPAGSDSSTAPPPAPPEVDHSGLTGPGFDLIDRQRFAPHQPAAHPDGPSPTPPRGAPTQPRTVTSPSRGLTGPTGRELTPVQPPTVDAGRYAGTTDPARHGYPAGQWPGTGAPGDPAGEKRGGRTGLVVAVSAAAVAVVVLGVGGYAAFGGEGGEPTPPKPAPTATPKASSGSSPVVPPAVMRAAVPRLLRVRAKGPLAVLRWRLAKSNDYPIWVQQSDGGAPQAPQALPAHTERVTIGGLDPTKGYCFTVGSMVALGQSNNDHAASIAWSKPACIRGAVAQ